MPLKVHDIAAAMKAVISALAAGGATMAVFRPNSGIHQATGCDA